MSKWPDGFDVDVRIWIGGWSALVHDRRPGIAGIHLPGYTTREEAEGAAIDWIQRRVGKPVTVPQPVLAEHCNYQLAREHIEDLLGRLFDIKHALPTPKQAEFPHDRQHIAAADCNLYRRGLIEALRQSLQAERDLIQEKLWENK